MSGNTTRSGRIPLQMSDEMILVLAIDALLVCFVVLCSLNDGTWRP